MMEVEPTYFGEDTSGFDTETWQELRKEMEAEFTEVLDSDGDDKNA